MFNGIFISLAYNAALLLTLGIIFDSVTLRNYRSNWWAKVLSGISLGIISLVIMINPWEMAHGIVFDTRSILFCIVGMFFGIIPAFISASIAAAYRIYLGGNGVYMGVSVIVASVLWGYMWKRTHSRWKNPYGLMEFYSLGIVTHLTMLGLTILLPISDRAQVLYTIAFPVLLLYPLITVILGKLLVRRLELRQERTDLKRSIKQFRSLYESAPIAYQSMDDNGNYISVNTAWLNTMGYELDEVLGKNISEFLHPDHILLFQECFDNFKVVGHINNAEHLLIKKDGSPVLASFDGVVLAAENGNFLQAQCLLTDITQRKKAELILAQSEEKYRLLAETAQDIIIVHLIDGSVTYANPKAFSFFNVPVDELPSMNIFDFVSPKDHPILAAHALERQQGFMGSYLYQLELNNKSGIKMQVEISSSPIITNDKVTGVLAVVRDITERLADQLAIQESQARFKLFMDNFPGGAFIKDSLSTVLYVNRYLNNVHESYRKIGFKPHDIYPDDIAEATIAEDQETLKTGFRNAVEEIVDKDGNTHLYETTKFTIPNPSGEPFIGGMTVDVTRRMQAEEQLNRYAKRLEILRRIDSIVLETLSFGTVSQEAVKSLQELIPFTVLTLNVLEGEYINVRTLLKPEGKYGYLVAGMKYQPDTEFFAELKSCKTVIVNDADKTSISQLMNIRAALVNDGINSIMCNALMVQDKFVGYLGFSSPILNFFTDEYKEIAEEFANQVAIVLLHLHLLDEIRQHSTELEQKVEERTKQLTVSNKELETFSYSVAHDLRAPLRTIDGYCNILIDDYGQALEEDAQKLLNTIRETSHRMDTLIKELLELAKLTRNALKYSKINMLSIATDICNEVVRTIEPEQFDVIIDNLPDCYGDISLIRQVWQNLLENAVKFTKPCEQRQIHIGFQRLDDTNVYYVKDSGVGFNMEFVDKIFGSFQRLHRQTEFEGTGIGLALVKKIITRHNGNVWAESELGKGTTLYFSLPDSISDYLE